MKYTGVIFDMDGVLFDTERLYQETWHELAEEQQVTLGSTFHRDICGTSGRHMDEVLERYYGVEDGAALGDECRRRMREKLSQHVPEKIGVREILKYLKEHQYRIAVASSSQPQQIAANLDSSGIRHYFDEVVSGKEVQHGKPAPDIFLLAAERIGCDPTSCFVFEDSENGVRAGHAAGCYTIMVPDLLAPSEEIRPYCSAISESLIDAMHMIHQAECSIENDVENSDK